MNNSRSVLADRSLDNTDSREQQDQVMLLDIASPDCDDDLDQPVLVDTNLLDDINAELRNRMDYAYDPVEHAASCNAHGDHGRGSHEYDPVYVPHNDAESMARRVDESSYVRTPRSRTRRNNDPYEEVQRRPRVESPDVENERTRLDTSEEDLGPAPVAPPRVASAGATRVTPQQHRRPAAPPPLPPSQ